MTNNIDKTLESLEEAVIGVNEVNNNLETIKKLHSQFDEKSKKAIEKVSSAEDKLDEISKIRDQILNTKNEFDEEYNKVLSIVNDTIIPVKNDLLNTKSQITRLQSTVEALKNSDGTTKVIETKSPELEKEILSLKSENTALLNKFKQLEALVISRANNSHQQSDEKPVVVITKKTSDNTNPTSNESGLKTFFIDKGCEVIDKRPNGGALWVVGDEKQLKPILDEMKTKFGNVHGTFAAGRATKQRRGWFTQDKR